MTESEFEENFHATSLEHDLNMLSSQTDRADLRKIYARLLRKYSPETRPAEFQRIRAVYEARLKQLHHEPADSFAWFKSPTAVPAGAPSPIRSQRHVEDHFALWSEFEVNPSESQIDRMRLYWERNASATVALMLYWMQKMLQPTAEDAHFQTILEAINRFPNDGRLWKLYRYESGFVRRLTDSLTLRQIQKSVTSSPTLRRCIQVRWLLLCEQGRWQQLNEEFEELRVALRQDDYTSFVRTQLEILNYALFVKHPWAEQLSRSIREEISKLAVLERSLRSEFDRLDLLTIVHDKGRLTVSPLPLIRLLTERLHSAATDFTNRLFEILRRYIDQPDVWLNEISQVATLFPAAFEVLQTYMEFVSDDDEADYRDDAELDNIIRVRVRELMAGSYEHARNVFITICRDECISFNRLVCSLGRYRQTEPSIFAGLSSLSSDRALQVACQSLFAFLCRSQGNTDQRPSMS
ncbi:MAG: hypothetical protein JNM43_20920 [Planctomycetaceae bacterium]|nr:hypothetical protein [Planctomycetaceae bacterium]